MPEPISRTSIDFTTNRILGELYRLCGVDAAHREIFPLVWYVETGRASLPFLHALIEAKPFMIARRLHAGGSDEEAIARIKTYLRIE